MEIEVSVRFPDSSFLFGERGQGELKGEKISSTKREQNATPKQF